MVKPISNLSPHSPYTPVFKDAWFNKLAKETGFVIDPLNRKATALEIEFFCQALINRVGKEVLKTIKEEMNKL